MSLPNPYVQYQQNAATSASPGELTLMLYNGLVKFLNIAIKSIEENDVTGSHNSLVRSQEILAYLNQTLDFQHELSQNLSALYGFMTRRLMDANSKKDLQAAREVLELAEDLRITWQRALKSINDMG